MTLTVELSKEAEGWVQEQARQRGLEPSRVVEELIETQLPVRQTGISDEEFESIADQLAELGKDLPVLPDEAYSRESFYVGRL